MKQLESLFKSYTGFPARAITELPSSGSNRRYFRIEGEHGTLIGTFGSCKEENKAFIAIAEHFRKQGLPVPEVYAHSRDFSCYLQQDLGDRILYNAVEEGRSRGNYNTREKKLLFKAMEALPALQFKGAEGLDFGVCYPQPEFDERMISFDLNYFK
ncbi:MAG: phosphotransferase, partial [Bacteroidales bacterium]|nr:phosphotransferase [Bacteroidales bacterium]